MSLIGAILALLFLDAPLKWVVAGCLVTADVFEIWLWLRWRKRRSITGPEGLIGTTGVVVSDLDPHGQVRAKGQIWRASAADRVSIGTAVEIREVDGLQLVVEPVASPR
jgi:membrane protein implicated in regulation of membrane protease activity